MGFELKKIDTNLVNKLRNSDWYRGLQPNMSYSFDISFDKFIYYNSKAENQEFAWFVFDNKNDKLVAMFDLEPRLDGRISSINFELLEVISDSIDYLFDMMNYIFEMHLNKTEQMNYTVCRILCKEPFQELVFNELSKQLKAKNLIKDYKSYLKGYALRFIEIYLDN